MRKEEGKKHMKSEMRALKKGGASKAMIAGERAEYMGKKGGTGMKNGGMVGGKSHACKPA